MILNAEIYATPDHPVIRMRTPRDLVDLEAEIPKIMRTQGWGVGTVFTLQFISHDRTALLSMAQFVVTSEVEELQTTEPSPYQTLTKAVSERTYAQVGDWLELDDVSPSKPVPAGDIRWNPGAKAHEVLDANGKTIASFTKDEGGKASAEAFVANETAQAA